MRPAVCLIAALTLLLPATATAADAPSRIAVVDLDSVLRQSAAGQALQAKLAKVRDDAILTGKKMGEDSEALRRRIADGRTSLGEARLTELQKEYEDKLIEMKRFRDDLERTGGKIQEEGLAIIEKALDPVFKAIQTENDYDIILNNAPGIVIVVGERVNITKLVIERLDASGVTP